MKIRLAYPIQSDSIVDGEGIRTVIWTQGCSHNCEGCHNPETHSFKEGTLFEVEEIKKQISNLNNQDGITFSGGDPMMQAEACNALAEHIKSLNMNIWCYTGYTYEQLITLSEKNKSIKKFLENIDVLVDGRFILNQKSFNLRFKGSRNQRIIDVKKSLQKNKVVLVGKYKNEIDYSNKIKKEKYMYV